MMSWTFPVKLPYWIFAKEYSAHQLISLTKSQWRSALMLFILLILLLNNLRKNSLVVGDLASHFMCRYITLRYQWSRKYIPGHGLAEKAQSYVCSILNRMISANWCKYKPSLSSQDKRHIRHNVTATKMLKAFPSHGSIIHCGHVRIKCISYTKNDAQLIEYFYRQLCQDLRWFSHVLVVFDR